MEEVVVADETLEEGAVAEETVAPKKQRKPINQAKLQDNLWGWLFCLPLIIGTVWFVYICLVMALLISFTNYEVMNGGDMFAFVGQLGKNINPEGPFYWYKYIFTQKTAGQYPINEMGAYLFNTVFYMIGIPIGMILAMFFAVCMSRDIKGGNVFRVLYYLPCVASTISIIYTFKTLFSAQGVMNGILGLKDYDGGSGFNWIMAGSGLGQLTWNGMTGGQSESEFMNSEYWCQGIFTKLVIIVMSVWKGLGGTIILYIAGLSGVNGATKEAAQIDGASGWKIFWKVTMPDLYPVIFYNIVTSVIGGMQIYMEPTLLVGENYLTSGYVSLIQVNGVDRGISSMGAAYGMVLAIMIFALTMFQFWLDSRNNKD